MNPTHTIFGNKYTPDELLDITASLISNSNHIHSNEILQDLSNIKLKLNKLNNLPEEELLVKYYQEFDDMMIVSVGSHPFRIFEISKDGYESLLLVRGEEQWYQLRTMYEFTKLGMLNDVFVFVDEYFCNKEKNSLSSCPRGGWRL